MTRIEAAAADFANAYRAWAIKSGQTFNIEVATAYATKDVLNMAKGAYQAEMVEMEAEDMWKAVRA
jgi:hypothetical protein